VVARRIIEGTGKRGIEGKSEGWKGVGEDTKSEVFGEQARIIIIASGTRKSGKGSSLYLYNYLWYSLAACLILFLRKFSKPNWSLWCNHSFEQIALFFFRRQCLFVLLVKCFVADV